MPAIGTGILSCIDTVQYVDDAATDPASQHEYHSLILITVIFSIALG